MLTALLVAAALFVAFSNGANDNFKGVATLLASGTVTYRGALALATAATFAGALCSAYFAGTLAQAFSGKGLVPDAVASSPGFVSAVAAGAGATVFLATRLGFPVSTTHALTGALAGAGFLAVGPRLNFVQLGAGVFAPLLLSPLLAVLLSVSLHRGLRVIARRAGIRRESCVCAGARELAPMRRSPHGPAAAYPMSAAIPVVDVSVGTTRHCVEQYRGRLFGVSGRSLVDGLHYLSAGTVSFARGLNDTPKIAGLLIVAQASGIRLGVLTVATAMTLGGLIAAKKVAFTMSGKIARMDDGQALAANLVTGALVLFASRLGLPVSTTHVAVGAIGGIGIANDSADKGVMGGIVASWLLTLPLAAAIGASAYAAFGFFG
jgi:inorganic phosphate transporter, PiT family